MYTDAHVFVRNVTSLQWYGFIRTKCTALLVVISTSGSESLFVATISCHSRSLPKIDEPPPYSEVSWPKGVRPGVPTRVEPGPKSTQVTRQPLGAEDT